MICKRDHCLSFEPWPALMNEASGGHCEVSKLRQRTTSFVAQGHTRGIWMLLVSDKMMASWNVWSVLKYITVQQLLNENKMNPVNGLAAFI